MELEEHPPVQGQESGCDPTAAFLENQLWAKSEPSAVASGQDQVLGFKVGPVAPLIFFFFLLVYRVFSENRTSS